MTKDKNDNPSEDNEEDEDDIEESDDGEEESDTETASTPSDSRLKKSINRMIKETGIDKEKLKGLSLEDQFDRLEFLLDNLPEEDTKKKRKNKPVTGMPTGSGGLGRRVKVGGKTFYHFHPSEWLKFKKEEIL